MTEQSVMGWSVTSGKCDRVEMQSRRKDWGVNEFKWRDRVTGCGV